VHIIFCYCERQNNKMTNLKFVTENLEEIWDVQFVAVRNSCLCLSKNNFSDISVDDNTKR
jgi:hypothetical protein